VNAALERMIAMQLRALAPRPDALLEQGRVAVLAAFARTHSPWRIAFVIRSAGGVR
jgi:hypothetical protein